MGNRIFVALVMLLWVSTMSWLMVARILPPFFQGEPPTHGIRASNEPMCWQIQYGDRPVGYAVSQTVPGALDTTEIYSRVLLERIELRQFAPQWMESLVRSMGEVSFDTRTRLVLDSLGSLSTFDTVVKINDMPIAMKVMGRVDGPDLKLRIQSGDISHEVSYPVANKAWMSSELMPESKLLPVYVGRKWQQEVFSPFRPPNSSLELMQAEVVEESVIEHRHERVNARKIEMRTLTGAGVAADNTLRAVMWVADDGTVLRQDVYMINATNLRFERCHEPAMIELAGKLLDLERFATIAPTALAP